MGGRHELLFGLSFLFVALQPSNSAPGVAGSTATVLLQRRVVRKIHVPKAGGGTRIAHKTAFFGNVAVGTPAQVFSVVFDTGSGNLLLPSQECESVACISHSRFKESNSSTNLKVACNEESQDEEVSITFGTGEVWGRCEEDRICFGSLCHSGNFVASTFESAMPFNSFSFDGVMGLGLPSLSQGPGFNLVSQMAGRGALRLPVFSVFMSNDDLEASEVNFGQIKPEHMASELFWVDVTRDSGYWEVQIDDVTINGVPLGICEGCYVAVDTGTSELAGPTDVVNKLAQKLQVRRDCNNFESLPRLGFKIGDHLLEMEASDYVDQSTGHGDIALMPLDVPPPKGPLFVLGIPFLTRFYTVYDTSRRKVGFALARHQGVETQKLPKVRKSQSVGFLSPK